MSDWQGTGTALTYTHKTFGDLVKNVMRHRPDSTLTEIRESYNEFLREHDFNHIKTIKRTVTVSESDSITIDDDILAIKEVYLNDEKLKPMSYQDYVEGDYTTSGYFTVLDDTIYFSETLDSDDDLFFKASISMTEQDEIVITDELDFNNIWFNVAVNWVTKELYQMPDNYDQYQTQRFTEKYYMSLEKAASQVLNESGYKSKAFESLNLDYGWED